MKLDIQAICHKGMVRENNEDALSIGGLFIRDDSYSITVNTPEEGFFYLFVSDGMGGHENGEEASATTLECLHEHFDAGRISEEDFEEDLRKCVHDISDRLNALAHERGQEHPMGCTLTGIVWHHGKVRAINAGDSRTFRFRNGILRPLTTEDTERGLTGDPSASKLLLNCVGGSCEGRLTIESLDGKLMAGDRLLICSDGLTDMVAEDEIEAILNDGCVTAGQVHDTDYGSENSIDGAQSDTDCDRKDMTISTLFRTACENGGADNISIILATVLG